MKNNKKELVNKKNKKTTKANKKIAGLDIDKMEYQEIVLSNSNFPDKSFYQNY